MDQCKNTDASEVPLSHPGMEEICNDVESQRTKDSGKREIEVDKTNYNIVIIHLNVDVNVTNISSTYCKRTTHRGE